MDWRDAKQITDAVSELARQVERLTKRQDEQATRLVLALDRLSLSFDAAVRSEVRAEKAERRDAA